MSYASFMIEFSGRELAAMDYNGYSDPYFIVHLILASGDRRQIFRSETIRMTLNPDWQPRVLYVQFPMFDKETSI